MFDVAFIHGRPAPHPFHAALARSVESQFVPVDFKLRWHDIDSSRARRYLSWLTCAICFPRRSQVDLFLSEGPHFPPLIMRRLRLIRKTQKVVALLANETLYFIKTGQYRRITRKGLIKALCSYDGLICVGQMQADLAREITAAGRRPPSIYCVNNCVPAARVQCLSDVEPTLQKKRVVFIGSGQKGWRAHYKGIDLTIKAVALAAESIPNIELKIVGDWPEEYQRELSRGFGLNGSIEFLGQMSNIAHALKEASVCVHLGRGDAFPTSVLESMCAGVPPIVSEWTGTRGVVREVDQRLIVPLDVQCAAERIRWYLDLPVDEKKRLSNESRRVAAMYTEAQAIESFRSAIEQICA